jgi:uncharacterized protein YjiS (DUF1127 family)
MNFRKIIKAINNGFLISGYSRAAYELLQLDDRYLKELGISRALLKQGYAAYPWREITEETAANVSNIATLKSVNDVKSVQMKPKTPIAA